MNITWRGIAEGDPVQPVPLRRRLRILRDAVTHGHPGLVRSAAVMIVLVSLAGAATSLTLKGMVDGAAEGAWTYALTSAGIAALAAGVNGACLRVYGNTHDSLAATVGARVNTDTIRIAGGMPGTDHLERPEYADQIALLRNGGAPLVRAAFSIADLLSLAVRVLIAVALLAWVHPLLAVAPLLAVPSVLLAGRAQAHVERAAVGAAEHVRTAEHLHGLFTHPTAAMEMRVFDCSDALDRRADEAWSRAARIRLLGAVRASATAVAGWLLVAAGYAAALLLVVAEARAGRATPGDVLLVAQVLVQLRGNISALATTTRQVTAGLRMADRYAWLADRAAEEHARYAGTAAVPSGLTDGIRLEGVRFTYPGAPRPALDGVDLLLPAGRTVAVVGVNGAGKTTLVKLLCGFHRPDAGRITVDGTDLADLGIAEWRDRVSGTFQNFLKLETSVQHSVGAGRPEHMDDADAVTRALRGADAEGLLARWPDGLATELGRSYREGAELSGGQWQKLAVARAMMHPAPLLLVLDEPTAALDPVAEHALYERYVGAAARVRENGGTVLLVSHRFSSVRMADLIVVLNDGAVEDVGTHDDLVGRGGSYAVMFRQQAAAFA
ncbi:ABC transporter ATP-binding protein [Yinghuangia sp. YIM S09857]|uniref:ABC transporter ATP-binding protein n=1 Tax=Yinghuangia sp. YIM S09857 TaxID=3436929 RepID=UPI003F52EC20